MIGYQCDGPECENFAFDPRMYMDWICAMGLVKGIMNSVYFCSRNCCGKYMLLSSSPSETV
jgi:hypothetical protein